MAQHPSAGARRGSAALLLATVASLPFLAAEDSGLYETATVRERSLTRATTSVTVLDREQIEAVNAITVAELIRFTAGLDLSTGGVRGGVATAQVRGGDPNFTVVLIDGVPLNDSTDQFGGAVNLNSLPVDHVERIEIVRGPLSSFFGSDALGGAINVITRRGSSRTPAVAASLEAGNAEVVRGAASLARGTDERDWFVGVVWEQEEERVADDRFEQLSLQGNAKFSVGESGLFRLTGRLSSWESRDYPEGSGGPTFGDGKTRQSDHDEFNLGLDWQFGGGERQHRLLASVYRHDLQRSSPAIPPRIPPSAEETRFVHTRLGWNYPLLQRKNNLLAVGAQLMHEDGTSVSALLLPAQAGGPIDGSYDLDRATGSAFVEYVAESGRLLWELAARVDVPEGFDTQFNPRGGLTYRFSNETTKLRGSIGRSFKLPSFYALGSPPLNNADLEPEVSLGADAAVEQTFAGEKVDTSLTLFFNRFEDLIDFDPVAFRLFNRSKVESRGVEWMLAWFPLTRLDLRVNLTYDDVEDADTGARLRNRPEWIGGARLRYDILPSLTWQVDGQSVSDRVDFQIPVPDRTTVDGFGVLGTALTWRLGRRWELRARADNLTDESYETFIGFPGAGRSYRVGVRFHTR